MKATSTYRVLVVAGLVLVAGMPAVALRPNPAEQRGFFRKRQKLSGPD